MTDHRCVLLFNLLQWGNTANHQTLPLNATVAEHSPGQLYEEPVTACDLFLTEIIGHIFGMLVLCVSEVCCGRVGKHKSGLCARLFKYAQCVVASTGCLAELGLALAPITAWEGIPLAGPPLDYPTAGVGVLSWLCCMVTLTRSRSRGGLALWSLIGVLSQSPRLWTEIAAEWVQGKGDMPAPLLIAHALAVACRVLLFASSAATAGEKLQRDSSECLAKGPDEEDGKMAAAMFDTPARCSHSRASVLSQLTFSWVAPLVTAARIRPLEQQDMFLPPTYADPAAAAEEFWQLWSARTFSAGSQSSRLQSASRALGKVQLWTVLWEMLGTNMAQVAWNEFASFVFGCCCLVSCRCCLVSCIPFDAQSLTSCL